MFAPKQAKGGALLAQASPIGIQILEPGRRITMPVRPCDATVHCDRNIVNNLDM
jgi:hypothetical protein